jgi:branched-subunit amino acid aminotransferase/4-amino-4-deoxychorismate lyase
MSTDSTVDPIAKVAPADAANWPLVLDGELMRAGEAVISADDDGLIRGDGAFDALPARDGRPFARAAHLDRLVRSCQALALNCPREQLESDIDMLLTQVWAGDAAVRVVREGPTCSIFWACHGRLQKPALETGILASITRRVILESMPAEEGRSSGRWPRALSPDRSSDARA